MVKCHDCAVPEGQIHQQGCDMERCPFCGGQLISCDCAYLQLKLRDRKRYGPETLFLPPATYNYGLEPAQARAWNRLLNQQGRIPWIEYPNLCCRCGVKWPAMFKVSDAEWQRYIQPDKQDQMLCRPCYNQTKRLIDEVMLS